MRQRAAVARVGGNDLVVRGSCSVSRHAGLLNLEALLFLPKFPGGIRSGMHHHHKARGQCHRYLYSGASKTPNIC